MAPNEINNYLLSSGKEIRGTYSFLNRAVMA
jgi:hypothetical protein